MEQNLKKSVVITFANQKGGVGKTTLCTLFANYLAAKGKSLLVVDCDGQQTIYEKRKGDMNLVGSAKSRLINKCNLMSIMLKKIPKTSFLVKIST